MKFRPTFRLSLRPAQHSLRATRRSVGRNLLVALSIALLGGLSHSTARAQNDIVPKEVSALFDDISDIDKMRIINPLKLTAEQYGKLIAAIKKAQDDYNKGLAEAAAPPIKQIAQDIKETRRRMLTSGGDVPKDFDEKVKKIQEEFVKQRGKQEGTTLQSLSNDIRAILTPEQFDKAVKLTRTLTEKDGKATLKGEDAKFFNFYVLGTFIQYSRIIPLLEDMKKTAAGSGGNARLESTSSHVRIASLTNHPKSAPSSRRGAGK